MSGTLRRVGGSLVDTTKEAQKLRREVERLNAQPINIREKLSQSFKNIPFAQYIFNPLTIAGVMGGRALKLGIDEEMRGASFEVLFGGEKNARKIIDNINTYARKTTYGKENLSAAVQTMAGFGIAQERIMPELKAIGEIAMGDKNKLSSLTLAFSQMSATGQLMGQDLLQMINAGFNPLLQMSKDTGKSVKQLKEDMGKGKISADMVAKAFQNATKEGGQFYGMAEKMSQTFGGQLRLAMANINDKLLSIYGTIQPYLLPVIKAFNLLLTDTGAFVNKVIGKLERWYNENKILGSIIITVTTAIAAYNVVVGLITLKTKAWAVASGILNGVLALNPIGLIIAGVVALIALITFLIVKIDGWGKTWDSVVTFCGLVFESFKTSLQLKWMEIQDFFMKGLEIIQTGWYKLQGLWDSEAANNGLAKMEAERNARAKEIADTQGKLAELSKQISEMEVIKLRFNDTSLSDITNSFKSKLGISSAAIPGMDGDTEFLTGGSGTGSIRSESGKTANNITTGGSKTTHITLSVGQMGNNMTVNAGNIREGAKKVRDIVLEELTNALLMAQANM